MSTTKIRMMSNALIYVGHTAINAVSEAPDGVANLYDSVYEGLLTNGAFRWSFARTQKALSRLTAAPLNRFDFAYQLPGDLIVPIGLYPATRYKIYGTKLYTNATAPELDYIYRADESVLPAYFVDAMEHALAAAFAKPVTEDEATADYYQRLAEKKLAKAKYADSQGDTTEAIMDNPFIDVRY